jgi:RNA polymerase sigma factor (sigma-70 family)
MGVKTRKPIERDLETFHPSSFGWALHCCHWNREEAEEVLQTAYLKAIDGRARFNGHSSTRTWFFGVVKLTAAERRRYRLVRRLALRRWYERRPLPDPVETPERLSNESEVQQRLRQALILLSPRQRDLLHLVFYEEMTIEEAADVLHISLGTARTHYGRGKVQLRKRLSGLENRNGKE